MLEVGATVLVGERRAVVVDLGVHVADVRYEDGTEESHDVAALEPC